MTSGDTREFMALMAIAQHHGRPHTPTDQAWIESFFGHVKAEWPHLEQIEDPAVLENELGRVREIYNTVRLHEAIGYVTPTTSTTAGAKPSAKHVSRASGEPTKSASPIIAGPKTTTPRRPRDSVHFTARLRGRIRHASDVVCRATNLPLTSRLTESRQSVGRPPNGT